MSVQSAILWALVPFGVSLFVCWLMIRLGPKDAPDGGRKTQARAVPTAGGLGILAGISAAFMTAGLAAPSGTPGPAGTLAQSALAGPAVLVLIAALLGYADDRFNLRAGRKLIVLAAAALFAALYGPHLAHVWLPGAAGPGYALPAALAIVGVALWLFIMSNATNFMDGANGLSLGSAAIMLATLAAIAAPPPGAAPGILHLVLVAGVAATLGFLAWNLSGQLYAGDTGALAIGALIGGAGTALATIHSVWVSGLVALPFLVDVFMTLFWRARHGRPLMRAHRDHAYQLLLRAGWRHAHVAGLWWGFSLVCAAAAMAGARQGPDIAFALFAGLLTLGVILWCWQRVTLGRRLAP